MFTKSKSVTVFLNGEIIGRLALMPENLCVFEYREIYETIEEKCRNFKLS